MANSSPENDGDVDDDFLFDDVADLDNSDDEDYEDYEDSDEENEEDEEESKHFDRDLAERLYEASINKQRATGKNIHIDPATTARWAFRAEKERHHHPKPRPFAPCQDDVVRWIANGAPKRWSALDSHQPNSKDAMRTPGYIPPSNGPANNIVEEYFSPSDIFVEDFQAFKNLSDGEKRSVIQREAEEYGMEKPQGYTVSFHYNPHVEYHHFGSSHPMKPWRLTLTKQLVLAYGLEYCMELYEPRPATFDELAIFHDREYLSFLSK